MSKYESQDFLSQFAVSEEELKDTVNPMENPATPRQIGYIKGLCKQLGESRSDWLSENMTMDEAKESINGLLDIKHSMSYQEVKEVNEYAPFDVDEEADEDLPF